MSKAQVRHSRREASLSRAQIVYTSIEILDCCGEDGLTFRALSERLITGPGAIYGHVANKNDLLTAACEAVIIESLETCAAEETPKEAIRRIALTLYDAMDAHPWMTTALMRAEVHSPLVRVLERVGQQIRALGLPKKREWATVSALVNYIVGVGAQNAANGQNARTRRLNRTEFLQSIADAWLQLDARDYPFVRSAAKLLPVHDDRVDFLSGINLILDGVLSPK